MIRAAVVGLGVGHAHCAGYLDSPHAELAAVGDLVRATALRQTDAKSGCFQLDGSGSSFVELAGSRFGELREPGGQLLGAHSLCRACSNEQLFFVCVSWC